MVVVDHAAMVGLLDVGLGLLPKHGEQREEQTQSRDEDEGVAELVEEIHAREDLILQRARRELLTLIPTAARAAPQWQSSDEAEGAFWAQLLMERQLPITRHASAPERWLDARLSSSAVSLSRVN